jgi:hypothetical protein
VNVLVIEPGHGSVWLEDAAFVNQIGEPATDGDRVRGTAWSHDDGANLPDGGIDIPETLTYPRSWVLKVETR